MGYIFGFRESNSSVCSYSYNREPARRCVLDFKQVIRFRLAQICLRVPYIFLKCRHGRRPLLISIPKSSNHLSRACKIAFSNIVSGLTRPINKLRNETLILKIQNTRHNDLLDPSPCLFEQIRAKWGFSTILEHLQTFSVQNSSLYTIIGIL